MYANLAQAVTIVESICGTNGCDAGETVLGVTLILAALIILVVLFGVFG